MKISKTTAAILGESASHIFRNDKCTVASLDTLEDCRSHGRGTNWDICNTSYWNKYRAEGVRFYVITPKDSQPKVIVGVWPDGDRTAYSADGQTVSCEALCDTCGIPSSVFAGGSPAPSTRDSGERPWFSYGEPR